MAFTEFYCHKDGNNKNAGSTVVADPIFEAVAGTWDNTTKRYIPGSGNPSLVAVSGDFASLYINGSGLAQRIHRIESVDSSGYLLSSTCTVGTTLITSSGNIASRVGGAWFGPSDNINFPSTLVGGALKNGNNILRVNFKNDNVYNITTMFNLSTAGPVRCEGYSNTPGDGGKVIFDGSNAASGFTMIATGGGNYHIVGFVCQNNGSTGSHAAFFSNGFENVFEKCVARNIRTAGFYLGVGNELALECEAYNCNLSNGGTNFAMFANAGNTAFIRCISHDNTGVSGIGFFTSSSTFFDNCISYNNTSDGFRTRSIGNTHFKNCDAYNNGGNGINLNHNGAMVLHIENCNLFKNAAYGINGSGGSIGGISSCAFGTGDMANTSGNFGEYITTFAIQNTLEYPENENPWFNIAAKDFRLSHPLAKGRGRGGFIQYEGGNTVGYPDIGAASHLSNDERRLRTDIVTTINPTNPVNNAGSTINGIPRA